MSHMDFFPSAPSDVLDLVVAVVGVDAVLGS